MVAQNPPKRETATSKFILGGCAGMSATCIVQPFDLMKSRLQVKGEGVMKQNVSILKMFREVRQKDGIFGFYNGLSAALARQVTYTAGRMGTFDTLNSMYKKKYDGQPMLIEKMGMGCISGAVGALLGNPTEVALVRMTIADRAKDAAKPSLLKVWSGIVRYEGFKGLYSGCLPTVYRSMTVNCVQLASYAQIKQYLALAGMEGFPNYFCASFISGLATALVSLPVDMAKTRLQKDSAHAYKNTVDVLAKVVKKEGFLSLWKGFLPYYVKIGSHTVLCFMFLEKYKELYANSSLNL